MNRKNLHILAVLLVLLVSTAGCSTPNATPEASEFAESSPTPAVEVNWAPKSYTQYDDSIAYKYTTNKGSWPCQDCNFVKITIIANVGCPDGVYAEVNFKNSSGTVVEWTNDSIPYLGPGEKAILTFQNYPYDSNITKGQLTALSCY